MRKLVIVIILKSDNFRNKKIFVILTLDLLHLYQIEIEIK